MRFASRTATLAAAKKQQPAPDQLTIYVGTQSQVSLLEKELNVYSSGMLHLMMSFIRCLFDVDKIGVNVDRYESKKVAAETARLLDVIKKDTLPARTNVAHAAAMLFSDERNLVQIVGKLSEEERRLWRKALSSSDVAEKSVRKALNITSGRSDQFISAGRFAWLCPTMVSVNNYRWSWGRNKPELKFTISDIVRPYIAPVFFPDLLKKAQVAAPPSGKATFSDPSGALKAFASVEALEAAGIIGQATSASVTLAAAKGVAKATGLEEFFPEAADAGDKNRQLTRVRMVANMLCSDALRGVSAPEKRICAVLGLESGNIKDDAIRRMMLPQLRGSFSTNSFDESALRLVRKIINSLAVADSGEQWVDVKGFVNYLKIIYGIDFGKRLVNAYDFGRANLRIKYARRELPKPGDAKSGKLSQRVGRRVVAPDEYAFNFNELTDLLAVPIVKGTVFLLAALGCAEVAYDSSDDNTMSPFAGLACWRLTNLGRYALGLVDSCDITATVDTSADFALDDRYLLITVVNPASTMRGLLGRFAKLVSGNRYVVTPETFLRGCHEPSDIDDKVGLLRRFVCPDPPQVWLDFFDTLARRVGAVAPDAGDYVVYTISAADKELQQYLAMAPEMRSIAICAQGFRVLVARDNDGDFRALLRERGYMI